MAVYRITFHGEDDTIEREQDILCIDDEDAIEHAGAIEHLEALRVWRDERLVALFTRRSSRRRLLSRPLID
jgi:hypothetical protein